MAKIFICYRRSDTGYQPKTIKDNLEKWVGKNVIFIDHDITAGQNWRNTIKNKINQSSMMLVLIGKEWLKDHQGRQRLFEEDDVVRHEIESAIAIKKRDPQYKIISMLFEDALMPNSSELPESIAEISDIQATVVNAKDIDHQLAVLGKEICLQLNGKWNCLLRQYKRHIIIGIIAVSAFILSLIWFCDKPKCLSHNNNSDIKITINPVFKGKKLSEQNKDNILDAVTANLRPYYVSVNFFDGKSTNTDQSELATKSSKCGAQVFLYGSEDDCEYQLMDGEMRKFFAIEFDNKLNAIHTDNISVKQLACLLKTYLAIDNYKLNANLSNCLPKSGTEIPMNDVDKAIIQIATNVFEKNEQLDSALATVKKLENGGLNPEKVFAQHAKIAEKQGNYNEAIVANSKLIQISSGAKKDSLMVVRSKHFEKVKEYDSAKKDLEEVKKRNPNDTKLNKDIDRINNTLKEKNNFVPSKVGSSSNNNFTPNLTIAEANVIKNLEFNRQNNNDNAIDQIILNNANSIKNSQILQAELVRIDLERGKINKDSVPEKLRKISPALDRATRISLFRPQTRGN